MDKLSEIISNYKTVRYNAYLRRIDDKTRQIKRLNQEIAELNRAKDTLEYLAIDHSHAESPATIVSIQDKIHIIEDMMRDFGDECNFLYSGLFSHADNIRFEYHKNKQLCPEWFVEKYGCYFKQ